MYSSIKQFSAALSLAVMVIAAPGAVAADGTKSTLILADKLFLDNAAYSAMTEIKAGQLAQQKGASDTIKSYGKKVVDDHAETTEQLKALAVSKSATLPTALDARHKAVLAPLEKASGSAFDAAFIKAMKHSHAETVAQYDRAGASRDEDISIYAKKTLPILKEHAEGVPSAVPSSN